MMHLMKKRLFLGNLPPSLSQSHLEEKLREFGGVLSVQMKQRTDDCGNILSSFAFVDIETDCVKLESCFKRFKSELWCNHKIKIELAKESFLERLKREQNSAMSQNQSSNSSKTDSNSNCKSVEKHEKDSRSIGYNKKNSVSCNNQSFIDISKDHTSRWDEAAQKEKSLKSTVSRELEPDVETDCREKCSVPKLCAKHIENGSIILEKENTIETSGERNGCLLMFTGTKNLPDLDFNYACGEENRDQQTVDLNEKSSIGTERAIDTKTSSVQQYLPMFSGTKISNLEESYTNETVPLYIKKEKHVNACSPDKKPDLNHDTHSLVKKIKVEKKETLLSSRTEISESDTNETVPLHQEKRKYVKACSPDKKSDLNHDTHSLEKRIKVEKKETMLSSSAVKLENCKVNKSDVPKERTRKKLRSVVLDDEKRLNALGERKKVLSLQKEAVKKALSSVDLKAATNKKIVFDIDEDNDGTEQEELPKGNNCLNYAVKSEADKHKLFGDSSDDEELKDLETKEFKIKPQFEGPKGQKLLAMQSRFANDSRFNLDERFLESGDEDEHDNDKREENDLDAEKTHQLNILQEILGVDVTTRKAKKERLDNRNCLEMVRFDPTNPKHSKFIMKEEKVEEVERKKNDKGKRTDKGKRKGSEEEEEVEEETLPMTSKERFYTVSDTLREALKKRNDQSLSVEEDEDAKGQKEKHFSLLEAFGGGITSDNEEEEVKPYASRTIKKAFLHLEQNPFKYDSSDDDEDGKEATNFQLLGERLQNDEVQKPTPNKDAASKAFTEGFHFKEEDPRLKEGLAFFNVNKTYREMQEGFEEKRTDLKMIIKIKVRNNKRKKLPFRRKLGGARRFKRNSSSFKDRKR